MGKYFNITVKPTISVAALAAGNITSAEILSDWQGFDVPKGASKLIGVTILYDGKNGVDYTPTDFELFWAKSILGTPPPTMGASGAQISAYGWFDNIIGKTFIDASSGGSNDANLVVGNVVTTGNVAGGASANSGGTGGNALVLQGEPDSGTSVGFDTIYVATMSHATHNWGESTMQVSTETTTTSPVIIVKTLNALISVGHGDILRDEDDQLLGTVKTVDSATQITLETNCASVSAVNKLVYVTTPITLILSLEK